MFVKSPAGHGFAGIGGYLGVMGPVADIAEFEALIDRVRAGDRGVALGLMRAVRSDELSRVAEIRVVDALYEARGAFRSKRLHFALALMCARTGARARGRALLLELVALEYPPALHCLGCAHIETGRAEAGLQLLSLARASGYQLGDVAYWRYRARMTRGPRRGWLMLRAILARRPRRRPMAAAASERDIKFWLPE